MSQKWLQGFGVKPTKALPEPVMAQLGLMDRPFMWTTAPVAIVVLLGSLDKAIHSGLGSLSKAQEIGEGMSLKKATGGHTITTSMANLNPLHLLCALPIPTGMQGEVEVLTREGWKKESWKGQEGLCLPICNHKHRA